MSIPSPAAPRETPTYPEPALPTPVSPAILRRLQGDACIDCGDGTALKPVGFAYTLAADGSRLGWPVSACATHRNGPPPSHFHPAQQSAHEPTPLPLPRLAPIPLLRANRPALP
jgi:hypothetical protein